MNKMFLAIILALGFSVNSIASEGADPELAADAQLDSIFEAESNSQLQTDRQFVAQDAVTSERELKAEKNRIQSLKTKNERLNSEIKKHAKLAKERRTLVARENIQTRRLESQAQYKERQLEKIKIANVELRKSIQDLQERKHRALVAQRRADALRRQQMAAHKNLKERKQRVLKASRVLRLNTAGL